MGMVGESEGRGGGGLLGVDSAVGSGFEEEDAGADVGVLAAACLAFAVKVPDRFREGFNDVWVFLSQDVVDVVRRYDVGLASFERARDAE